MILRRIVLPLLAFCVAFSWQPASASREPIDNRAREAWHELGQRIEAGAAYATAVEAARGPACPVPSATFVSSWGAPRTGHTHQGNDLMADFGTPILAPEDGTFEGDGESFYLYADSGTTWFVTHNGGDLVASGSRVTRGQPVSTVSNTGNASGGSPHAHVEIHPNDGEAVDPYPVLSAACFGQPAPARTLPRVTASQIRFCRYVVGNIGARFVACLHVAEGHHQGQRGHLWSDYVRQARQFRRFLAGLAPRTCSGPADCPALIRAAFDFMGVGWRGSEAVSVATCESGLNPNASNGSHGSLFQQSFAYWDGRARTYGMAGRSVFDPWANSVVSAGMVRDTGGWSHWSCQPG